MPTMTLTPPVKRWWPDPRVRAPCENWRVAVIDHRELTISQAATPTVRQGVTKTNNLCTSAAESVETRSLLAAMKQPIIGPCTSIRKLGDSLHPPFSALQAQHHKPADCMLPQTLSVPLSFAQNGRRVRLPPPSTVVDNILSYIIISPCPVGYVTPPRSPSAYHLRIHVLARVPKSTTATHCV